MEKCRIGLKNYHKFLDDLEQKQLKFSIDPSITIVELSYDELDDPDLFDEEEYEDDDCLSSEEAIESDAEDVIDDELDHTLLSNEVNTPTKKPEQIQLQSKTKSMGKSLHKHVLMLNGQITSKSLKQLSYSKQGDDGYSMKEIANILKEPLRKSYVKTKSLKYEKENNAGNVDRSYKRLSIDYQKGPHLMNLKILVQSSKLLAFSNNHINPNEKIININKPCSDILSNDIEEYPTRKCICPADKPDLVQKTRPAAVTDILDIPFDNLQTVKSALKINSDRYHNSPLQENITNKDKICLTEVTSEMNETSTSADKDCGKSDRYVKIDRYSSSLMERINRSFDMTKQRSRKCDDTQIQKIKGSSEVSKRKHTSPIGNCTTAKMDRRFPSNKVSPPKEDLLGMPLVPLKQPDVIQVSDTDTDSCGIINASITSLKRKRQLHNYQELNSRRYKRRRVLESDSSDSD